jgi:hypothetical protein
VSRRTAIGCALVVVLAAMVTTALVGTRREDARAIERPTGVGPQGSVPQFVVECAWSHTAPDDPIVHAHHAGAAHLHDFFGNSSTSADSTLDSLLAADTTCDHKADTAAYWAPALSDHGEVVRPVRSLAYYRPGPGVDPTTVEPFPPGLVMIGGEADSGAQPVDVAAWRCGASPVLASEPPICPRQAPLGVRVVFADCWDGRRTDSDDHVSHVARSASGACPSSHPVPIPQLTFEIRYLIHGDGHRLELASGGVHGVHADFVNAWDQRALEREVHACLNLGNVCGVVSNRATG